MIDETEVRRIAEEAVLDRIDDWHIMHMFGWMTRFAHPKFITCDVVQEDERAVYVLKGYVYVDQDRSLLYPRGGGNLALLLLLVKLDAETGKTLEVDHREREWKMGYSPSVEEFDGDWASGVKDGEWTPWTP